MSEVSIGIEASSDRRHVSVVQCGEQERKGRIIFVACLSHYLDGDADVVEIVTALKPIRVGIDAVGPGRHLIDRLEDAHLHLALPTFKELTDAQTEFLAKVSRRELFIGGGRELDLAVQHVHLRTGENVPRLSRQGPADQSPLGAAVLSLWAYSQRGSEPWFAWT